MKPMLSTPMNESTLAEICKSDDWVLSQKIDGRRALVVIEDGKITCYGRDGQKFSLGMLINLSFSSIFAKGKWCFDGELVKINFNKNCFMCFDVPMAGDIINFKTPFQDRLETLEHIYTLTKWEEHPPLGKMYYARTFKEKVTLVTRLRENHAEGVVARKLTSPYVEGSKSLSSLKFKFVLDADCVVMDMKIEGKDNILLGVYKDGVLTEVGKCTALSGDGFGIKLGDVVTVRYLYLSDDGRLVQPTYPLIRTDKTERECEWSQLVPASKEILSAQDFSIC